MLGSSLVLDLLRAVRRFWAEQGEIQERIVLLNRPWEEDYLHWSGDGAQARIHGWLLPPDGRRRGVTRGGWCAASTSIDRASRE